MRKDMHGPANPHQFNSCGCTEPLAETFDSLPTFGSRGKSDADHVGLATGSARAAGLVALGGVIAVGQPEATDSPTP